MAKTKGVSIREISPEVKGINFDVWGGIDNFLAATSAGAGGVSTAQQLRRVVPWLAKATDMTANAISALPFDIVRENGDVYDTSTDWKNLTGGMDSPEHIFYLLASSLCLGRAYLIPDATSKVIVDFQYVAPHTVEPRITGNGLEWFDRTTDEGKKARYYPADTDGEPAMMYFWLPDSDVEIGPAQSFPAGTALMAANLLFSMDGTLQTYAERGFIPPTVLGAKGMPSGAEREKAENWWDRFFKGKTGVTAKIINTEALSIVKVGAGFEDLRGGYAELTKQAIENIGTAYGIPSGLFMSDMAFATEIKHLTKVWYSTSTFVKIYKAIEHGFNTQILNRWNLELKFRPDAIDAMQEEEMERATAFSTYVNAGVRPSIAAEMLGIELPAGMKYEMLDADLLAKQEQEQKLAEAQAMRFQQPDKSDEEEKKPIKADGRWVTINGDHVFIDEHGNPVNAEYLENDKGGKNKVIGKCTAGFKSDIYLVKDASNLMTEYRSVSVANKGSEILATEKPEAHSDIVKGAHPDEDIDSFTVDGYTRFGLSTNTYGDKYLQAFADSAGIVVNTKEENDAAINNIYKAIDKLVSAGLPASTKIRIYPLEEFGKPFETTAKSYKIPVSLSAPQIKELNLWRQIAERQFRKGKGACADFEVKSIPADMADEIRERLKYATGKEDIGAAFEVKGTPAHEVDNDAIKTLAEAINRAIDAGVEINADNPA